VNLGNNIFNEGNLNQRNRNHNINNVNNRDNNNRNNEIINLRTNIPRPRFHVIIGNINRNRNHGKHRIHNFPEIVIEDINKLEEGNKKCVICLEDFVSKEKVIALPCIHFFHKPCIKKWVIKENTCPICKFELSEVHLIKKIKENQ